MDGRIEFFSIFWNSFFFTSLNVGTVVGGVAKLLSLLCYTSNTPTDIPINKYVEARAPHKHTHT